ncbi:hypothetical protein ACHAPU_009572 [Fusarium lateritium]
MFISKLSQKCEQALKDACTDVISKNEIRNERENTAEVAQDHSSTSREQLLATLETEQGRFRIWAGNIGALRDPDSLSSLDSRLHSAPKVHGAIVSILEGLVESLDRTRKILAGELPNRTAVIETTDAGAIQGIKTELNELVLGVGSSITDLFRYSVLLRQQRPHGRETPSGGELPPPDSSLDVRHAKDKFPKLKSRHWLAERIGNAISQRRESYDSGSDTRNRSLDRSPAPKPLRTTVPPRKQLHITKTRVKPYLSEWS